MDTSQTTVCFVEPRNFLKNQLSSIVLAKNTAFYIQVLKTSIFIHFAYI